MTICEEKTVEFWAMEFWAWANSRNEWAGTADKLHGMGLLAYQRDAKETAFFLSDIATERADMCSSKEWEWEWSKGYAK
jgi:hypothetical protein